MDILKNMIKTKYLVLLHFEKFDRIFGVYWILVFGYHHSYFLDKVFNYQSSVYNGCHDVLMMSMMSMMSMNGIYYQFIMLLCLELSKVKLYIY